MKTKKLKVTAIACILIFGMSSCINSPSKKAENVENAQKDLNKAEESLQKSVVDSTNEYARYKAESEAKLQENDLKIAQIKTKLKTDKIKINAKYEKDLAELELKNSNLKISIEDYKETDKNKWEKFKTNFNHDLDEVGKSISKMSENK